MIIYNIDDEIDSWPLMNKPWYILTILLMYLVFVLDIGPKFMANRKPMNIKSIMLIYNATQTIYNAWLVCWVRMVISFAIHKLIFCWNSNINIQFMLIIQTLCITRMQLIYQTF
jgi:hypothetical protein